MLGTSLSDVRDALMGRPLTDMLHQSTLGKPECDLVLAKLSQAGCSTVSHWLLEDFGSKGRSLSQANLTEFLADRHGMEAVANPSAANPDLNVVVPADPKHLKVFKEIGINVEIGFAQLGSTSLVAAQPAAGESSTDSNAARDAAAFIAQQRGRYKRLTGGVPKPVDLCTDAWMLSVRKALDNGQLIKWALHKCTAANEVPEERTVRLASSADDEGVFMRHNAPRTLTITTVPQFLYVLQRRCVSHVMLGNCEIEQPVTSPHVGTKGKDGTQRIKTPGAAPGVHESRRIHTSPAPLTLYFAEFLRLAGGGAALQDLVRHDALAMGKVEQLVADENYNLGSAILATLEWPPVAGFLAGVSARGSYVAAQAATAMGTDGDNATRRMTPAERRAKTANAINAHAGQIAFQNRKPGGGGGRGTGKGKGKGKGFGKGGATWACKAYNTAAGCKKTNCKTLHCCSRCGQMGVKAGHSGCANP
jgi:hypothetical protein